MDGVECFSQYMETLCGDTFHRINALLKKHDVRLELTVNDMKLDTVKIVVIGLVCMRNKLGEAMDFRGHIPAARNQALTQAELMITAAIGDVYKFGRYQFDCVEHEKRMEIAGKKIKRRPKSCSQMPTTAEKS